MPIVKNTFIQSKMNKDLDGRIIPNGQYRDGQNVQISRSEGDDVGALENVLGNEFLSNFGITEDNVEIIGYLTDDTSDTMYLFLTNYTDSSPSQLSNNAAGIAGLHYIVSFNTRANTFKTLVQGDFLNFSITHPVLGVNLIENLLFFTDNRNQPRKINTVKADGSYYTNEDQISVSKYYPFEPISLLEKDTNLNGNFQSSMKDVVSEYLPIHAAAKVTTVDIGASELTLSGVYTNIKAGSGYGDKITGRNISGNKNLVNSTQIVGSNTEVVLSGGIANIEANDVVYFQRKNPFYNPEWAGDKNFLKERFARFSYRFRYIDGEYSLSAPFTQLAFVPEQDGYFIGTNATLGASGDETSPGTGAGLIGDEGNTINSTIVDFMKNKINDIGLYIPAPTTGNSSSKLLWNQVSEDLNILEIDILYKEAQSNKTTIVDTLTISDFGSVAEEYYYYNYQSRKPWKTLPPSQASRVSEATPIRALAQEVSGNRVMYANYLDKHTSPINLNYTININQKVDLPAIGTPEFNNRDYYVQKEYQNHTLKGNRTYQAGIVLYDRYGRQSNVILSSIINPTQLNQSGSTFYTPYKNAEDPILLDKYPTDVFSTPEAPYTWPGDQMNLIFYDIIPQLKDSNGYPGVYSEADGSIASLILSSFNNSLTPNAGFIPPCSLDGVPFFDPADPSKTGTANVDFDAAGTITSITNITTSGIWSNGENFIFDFCSLPPVAGCDACSAQGAKPPGGIVETTISNPLGWYSYKVVIKQQEQEYYNVYLPTAMAGYPCNVTGIAAQVGDPAATPTPIPSKPEIPAFNYPEGQLKTTSHIVLFGDNINKISRDLQEIGPTQEKYRSSVKLFGRVSNIIKNTPGNNSVSNEGYNPSSNPDIAVQISTMENLGLGDLRTTPAVPIIPNLFYKGKTNPQIARVEVLNQFGIPSIDCEPLADINDPQNLIPPNVDSQKFGTTLSVYETAPVESLLDIFWESTTSGLVSELNFNIENNDNTAPIGLTSTQINWPESDTWGDIVSSTFEAAGSGGQGLGNSCTVVLNSVFRGDGTPQNQIILVEVAPGTSEYYLQIDPSLEASFSPLFLCHEDDVKNEYFFNFTITRDNGVDPVTSIIVQEKGTVINATPVRRTNVNIVDGDCDNYRNTPLFGANGIKDQSNKRWDNPTLPIEDLEAPTIVFMPEHGNIFMGGSPLQEESNSKLPFYAWDSTCQITDIPINNRVGFGIVMATQPILNDTCGITGYANAKWMAVPGWGTTYSLVQGAKGTSNSGIMYPYSIPGTPLFIREDGLSGEWTFPKGKYNSTTGFAPITQPSFSGSGNLQNYIGSFPLENYPDGKLGNYNFFVNAPLNGGMNCCDKLPAFSVDNGVNFSQPTVDLFLPGWNRTGMGLHNGKFEAYNGVYGSEPATSFPPGFARSEEIVFSIPRMYQVSMYQYFFSTGFQSLGLNTLGNTPGGVNTYTMEYVFGLNPYILNPLPSVQTANPGLPINLSISTIKDPIPYKYTNLGTSSSNPSLPTFNLPTSPIYWDHESGLRPGSQGGSQSILEQGGEALLGQRYNNIRHYWPDLEALSQSVFDKFQAVEGWSSYSDMPNFQLQNGSNTFYQTWQGTYTPGDPNITGDFTGNSTSYSSDSDFWLNQPLTDKGFVGYIGGLDSSGIGNAFNKRYRFNPYTENVPTIGIGNYTNPRRGWFEAGDRDLSPRAWDVFTNGISDWLQGNGMPGGRYVVTLRATDRSIKIPGQANIPNPDGLYVEWDIPVTVPEWNLPFSGGGDCSFVNSGAWGDNRRWPVFSGNL